MYQEYNDKEKESLNQFYEVIKGFVEIGMEMLKHKMESKEILKTDLASYLLFRQILEMGDAISELIKVGCINASKPLGRSLLEYYFQFAYLLSENEELKALQFLYHYEMYQLDYHEKLAYPEREGSFFKKHQKDKYLKNEDISDEQKKICINNINSILQALKAEDYKEISKEYERVEVKKSKRSGKKGKVNKWYELFDGPSSVEGIAMKLEQPALYEQIYRDLSSYIHGVNIVHSNFESINKDAFGISALRDIRQMATVANIAIMLVEGAFLLFLKNKIVEAKIFAEKIFPFVEKAKEYGDYFGISTLKS